MSTTPHGKMEVKISLEKEIDQQTISILKKSMPTGKDKNKWADNIK